MATFKHISSKNADYGAAEKYLTFAHDEFSMKPTLDENGRLIPRENFRIATIGCGEEDFAIACMRANLRYGKNQKREDVKSHHYIISFDPRDGTDNGLTVDRAQQLGEEFCKTHFRGHQALVCTHPDGHNHSGNIHVHIVINSLRIEEVSLLPYMDRPADMKAGCRHRCTDAAMEYVKSEVMEMCHRENLYQIDLLHGSANRVTEREYWVQKKGQAALDERNAEIKAAGLTPRTTKFETDKEKPRQKLRAVLDTSTTFEQFSTLLLRQGITVKESRGRLSYLTPDRTKPITARKLGDDFDRAAVLARLEQNAHRVVEERAAALKREKATNAKNEQRTQTAKTLPTDDGLHTLVDREKSRAKSIWYDRWAAVYNVKQLAKTYNFIKGNGINDLDTLDEAEKNARAIVAEKRKALTEKEAVIKEKNELRKAVTDYRHTRPIVDEYRKLKGKKAEKFRQDHEPDFIIYESTKKKLQRLCPGNKLPSYTKLNAEIEALISQKNALYNEYYEAKGAHKEISTVQQNAKELHLDRQQPSRKKKHEQTL